MKRWFPSKARAEPCVLVMPHSCVEGAQSLDKINKVKYWKGENEKGVAGNKTALK